MPLFGAVDAGVSVASASFVVGVEPSCDGARDVSASGFRWAIGCDWSDFNIPRAGEVFGDCYPLVCAGVGRVVEGLE